MVSGIAIVGMGCRYPDARSPQELWENVLSQRRAFRSIPPERLRLEDYLSGQRDAPDSTYSSQAALIEGYEFDRVAYSVAGDTFRAADMAHWLALDIAAQALKDAGFENGAGLPRETTGVFLGNTLTGEFSRANLMRLRWPYVRRVVEASLVDEGWPVEQRASFLKKLETLYKEPFPNIGEESLAGGLSNTIAGRVCNHFDLKGGGYTIDGACASSLLAVANACSSLAAGDIDAALAGGVDLSLDPFELVGFAKAGALATDAMRIYDKRSNGFWPGEGCGFVVLMRADDAIAQGRNVYATIKGWGIASDGKGGITRPDVEGQLLAVKRAYRRAGFGIETVGYFEGHGTGTSVGDSVELQTLSRARRETSAETHPAVIGSVKANIGHTKAAAGIAGLIKATLAVKAGVIPPTTGCEDPHAELERQSRSIRVVKKAELWPADLPLRAGVSSMGFGGIDAHVVVEAEDAQRLQITSAQRTLMSSSQDAELVLLSAHSVAGLLSKVERLLGFAARISQAELADLAREAQSTLGHGLVRAAVVATRPAMLADRLEKLKETIRSGATKKIDAAAGVFFNAQGSQPRIGFLFPGQGSPSHVDGGALRRRFDFVEQLYERAQLVEGADDTSTEIAQPAIVTASLAALRVLEELGVTAQVGVGHSLGELTALHWAGAFAEETLLQIARVRGQAMKQGSRQAGSMASIAAGREEVLRLINHDDVFIAGLNSPHQTVISGETNAVDAVVERARAQNFKTAKLPVSHAFHSPLVEPAADTLSKHLETVGSQPLQRLVISTVTGEALAPDENLQQLLCRQITSPVLFMKAALAAASERVDLWLEVGPGQVLGGLISELTDTPVISIDAGGASLRGLLHAAGAVFVLDQSINHRALFEGRFTRPFDLDWRPRFFVNPCELAPVGESTHADVMSEKTEIKVKADPPDVLTADLLVQLVAHRTELPVASIGKDSRLLSDLHLNSITVSELVVEASSQLGLPPPMSPTDFADATIAEIAEALDEHRLNPQLSSGFEDSVLPAGVDSWIRAFKLHLVERPLARPTTAAQGTWEVFTLPGHPFADELRIRLEAQAASGVAVCLPAVCDEQIVEPLLAAARSVLNRSGDAKFVLVQHDKGAAGFARTLHLEAPHVTTCVVNVPEFHPQTVEWIAAEASAARAFVEAYYDAQGRRYEKVMRLLPAVAGSSKLPLTGADVLLATGGGKGVTAECAIALAKESNARLVLLGRAKPENDSELAANLDRMAAARLVFKYISADITDASAVRDAVRKAETEFGPVTAILHGAARNEPQLIANLNEQSFRETLAVKVQGARHVLAAIDPEKLRLFVAFGSVIARSGLPGESDYAVANEWLTRLVEDWKTGHPACRCLSVEWSIWSEIGMGARLARMDRLVRGGIEPIAPEKGVATLLSLLRQSIEPASVVVMGRYSDLPTFEIERPDPPFLRFLEKFKVYYPQVELVTDVDLSQSTDPYLNDHKFQGSRLLPAVIGLEAMAQAAAAVCGSLERPTFREIEFNHPVVVSETATLPIRLAALVRAPGLVEVVLRSAETGFQLDHFRALCEFGRSENGFNSGTNGFQKYETAVERMHLDPARDLYGNLLFQTGRFQRVDNYRRLSALECFAEIAADGHTAWFIHHLPDGLLLGDPGARDAALHAIQACIPHRTVLPVAAASLQFDEKGITNTEPLFISARERSSTENSFIYDLDILSADGAVRERWRGLKLQAVGEPIASPRHEALLGPYLERRVRDLIPSSELSIAFLRDENADRQVRSDRAIQTALGMSAAVTRRSDGKPEVQAGRSVSASHCGNLTMAVAGPRSAGCDLEQVEDRSMHVWRGLLGDERLELARLIERQTRESDVISATRVWSASEALKKAGATSTAPLTFVSATADGFVLLSSGKFRVVTYATQLREREGKFVIAVVSETQTEQVRKGATPPLRAAGALPPS